MVGKGVVLLGVQDLQKSGGWVPPPVGGELVDLVQQEDGVYHPHLLHPLDDLPGKCSDIGAPVAPDLRLIPHAT